MSQGRRNNIITSVRGEMTTWGQMRLACARSLREEKNSKNYYPMVGLFCIINFSHFISAYKNPKQLFKNKNSNPPLFLLINNTCHLEGLSDLTTKKLTGNPDNFKCQNRLAGNDERRLHNLRKHCARLLQASRGASSSLKSCHDITTGLWFWALRQLKLRFGPGPKFDIMCLNGSQTR